MRTRTPAQPLPLLGMQTFQIEITAHPNECTHGYKARVVLPSSYALNGDVPSGQGMVFGLSVLN